MSACFLWSLEKRQVELKIKTITCAVYWPSTRANMPFQRRGSCIFHWRRRAWQTIWDKVKSHGTVRLMHRKRVTCGLHDSYFGSMTIKHAIPRTAEVTHPDGQLWGDIEWVIELLYNSVKTGSQLVLETRWWQDAVKRTASSGEGLRLSSPGERERHTAISGGAREVNMLQSLFILQLPLTHNLSNKVGGIFFKRNLRLYLLLRQYVFCMYMCIYA